MMEAPPSHVDVMDITPVMENQKVMENETEAWMLRWCRGLKAALAYCSKCSGTALRGRCDTVI